MRFCVERTWVDPVKPRVDWPGEIELVDWGWGWWWLLTLVEDRGRGHGWDGAGEQVGWTRLKGRAWANTNQEHLWQWRAGGGGGGGDLWQWQAGGWGGEGEEEDEDLRQRGGCHAAVSVAHIGSLELRRRVRLKVAGSSIWPNVQHQLLGKPWLRSKKINQHTLIMTTRPFGMLPDFDRSKYILKRVFLKKKIRHKCKTESVTCVKCDALAHGGAHSPYKRQIHNPSWHQSSSTWWWGYPLSWWLPSRRLRRLLHKQAALLM